MDLGFLAGMTGLTNLTLNLEPITDLEALRPLTRLKVLNLSYCSKLKDISAVADMPELEELDLDGTAVTSLEVLRGHNRLISLSLNNLKVTDLSPLADCDYSWAEEHGGVNLAIDNDRLKDFSFMSAVPRFNWMGMGGINPDKWTDAVSSSRIQGIYSSGFKQDQLERFLEQHPELEELHIQDCRQLKDLSMLANMPNLRYVYAPRKMEGSIEGTGHSFQVEYK